MNVHEILMEIDANGKLQKEEFASDNILRAEAGTTGHMYNNGGKGTFTYVSLRNLACTGWNIIVEREEWGALKGFKLFAEGDAELDTLSDAFLFFGNRLKQMASEVEEERKNGRKVLTSDDKEYYPWGRNKTQAHAFNPIEEVDKLIASIKR